MESTAIAPAAGTNGKTGSAPAAGLTASQFLGILYPPGSYPQDAWLALWERETKATTWEPAGSWQAADAYATQARDTYFGVCLHDRNYGSGSRGSAKTTVAVPAIWIDIDLAGKPHTGTKPRKKNYPPREVVEKILALLPPASFRVASSPFGIHAYWLLNDPFRIENESHRERIAGVIKSWQSHIKTQLLKAGGYGADGTQDLARVLRLPASNHTGHPGFIVGLDATSPVTGTRYSLEEIEGHLPKGGMPATPARSPAPQTTPASPAKPAETVPTVGASRGCSAAPPSPAPSPADPPANYASETSEPPDWKLQNLITASPEFAALWEGRTKRPSPSEYDMSLANYAKNAAPSGMPAHWTDHDTAGLLVAFARRQQPDHLPKLLRVTGGIQDYLKLTIDKAKEKRISTNGSPANREARPAAFAGVTLEKVGVRIYFRGATFAHKDQIKGIGGHWVTETKEWWVGLAKEAEARELIGLPPLVSAEPAAEPAPPPSRWLVEARNHVNGLATVDDPAGDTASEDSFIGKCIRLDRTADETELQTSFRQAMAERRKAETDPQIRITAALEIARQGLGRDDLIEVLKIGRENPEFALVFNVAGKELQVELGQGDAVFNHKRIKIQLLISPLCHSIPDWKPKAWEGFATAIIQAAGRLVETSDSLKEVASIIKRAQAKNEDAQEIEPAEFDEKILLESVGKGNFYSPVYGKKGEPAVYVSLDRITDYAWTELRCTIERKEFSRRLAKLGFTPIQIQGRPDKSRPDKKRLVRLWRGVLPAGSAEGD